MATLAIPPSVEPVDRILGLLPPPGGQIGCSARAQPTPSPGQPSLEGPGLGAILAWLAAVPLLLAPVLWPVLLVAVVLLLVGLTPFVVGFKVLAALRRGRHAAG